MENTEHFGSLTPRMKAFREEVLDDKAYAKLQHDGLAGSVRPAQSALSLDRILAVQEARHSPQGDGRTICAPTGAPYSINSCF